MTVRSTDPCRCDHDFTEHTRTIGIPPYANSTYTDMACNVCACDDYIPVPYSDPGPTNRHLDYARPRL